MTSPSFMRGSPPVSVTSSPPIEANSRISRSASRSGMASVRPGAANTEQCSQRSGQSSPISSRSWRSWTRLRRPGEFRG